MAGQVLEVCSLTDANEFDFAKVLIDQWKTYSLIPCRLVSVLDLNEKSLLLCVDSLEDKQIGTTG